MGRFYLLFPILRMKRWTLLRCLTRVNCLESAN